MLKYNSYRVIAGFSFNKRATAKALTRLSIIEVVKVSLYKGVSINNILIGL